MGKQCDRQGWNPAYPDPEVEGLTALPHTPNHFQNKAKCTIFLDRK